MKDSIWISIFIMTVVSYLLRVIPITLIRKQIKNTFLRSVLYYLPYVTLSVMTVPTIFSITDRPVCGAMAMAAACVTAWFTSNLFLSASAACLAAFVCCLF